jgi:hypothetical protein
LVVAQPSSKVQEELMNYPVFSVHSAITVKVNIVHFSMAHSRY